MSSYLSSSTSSLRNFNDLIEISSIKSSSTISSNYSSKKDLTQEENFDSSLEENNCTCFQYGPIYTSHKKRPYNFCSRHQIYI